MEFGVWIENATSSVFLHDTHSINDNVYKLKIKLLTENRIQTGCRRTLP